MSDIILSALILVIYLNLKKTVWNICIINMPIWQVRKTGFWIRNYLVQDPTAGVLNRHAPRTQIQSQVSKFKEEEREFKRGKVTFWENIRNQY